MIERQKGYTLLILLFAVSVLSIGFIVAVPVWQTQIQREKEEELIFRGNQYVEAIRLYQLKKPGTFPKTLEELVEEKCLRRLYKDPMTSHGEWNIILPYQRGAPTQPRQTRSSSQNPFRPSRRRSGRTPQRDSSTATQATRGSGTSIQKIYIVPLNALSSVDNPQIIGVVSSSNKGSFKIYQDSDSYDKWLFFYGMDSSNLPEIVYYGQEEEKD
ncbi:MAG: type II secretion system protein [Candidatus Aminicenantes bacterium]|jgi:type II secretory pathway pseudopilin PulG